MKLSIVIPVYNVEKYIAKCLHSCIEQKCRLGVDYEIICVNDGSKDKSADIISTFISDYSGISLINKENGGLSSARNAGLNVAKGDYIWFVDSDDYISNNCLSSLIKRLDGEVDMLNIQYSLVFEDSRKINKQPIYVINKTQNGKEILMKGGYPTIVPGTIYKITLLRNNGISFYQGILHEDTEFMPRVLYFARRVESYKEYVYNYLQRSSGSITSNYKLKNGLDALKVCESLYKFSKTADEKIAPAFSERISQIIYTHLYRMRYLNSNDKDIMFEELRKKRELFHFMKTGLSLKCKLAGVLLSLNPKWCYYLFRVFYR